MKGKLNMKGKSFEDFENIVLDRFLRHRNDLKLDYNKLPNYMLEFAQTNFQSGFLDCILWLREKGLLKVKL